jgi:hypothetical protein
MHYYFQVKAIYLSFSKNISKCSSSGDCCHILFPLTSVRESNCEYYQWLRCVAFSKSIYFRRFHLTCALKCSNNFGPFLFFFRQFFLTFLVNENKNKVVYDAQKFIKTLINILNIGQDTGN